MKKYILSIVLSLALMLVLGTANNLFACGAKCTPTKSADCGPCPMSTADGSKAQVQTAKATACDPAKCQGDPSKCANCDCKGKGCDGKCNPADCKGKCTGMNGKCSMTSKASSTKACDAKVKTTKAVEAKAQPASVPKGNG